MYVCMCVSCACVHPDRLAQCVISSNLNCCSSQTHYVCVCVCVCVRLYLCVRACACQEGDREELLSHHGDWLGSHDRIFLTCCML